MVLHEATTPVARLSSWQAPVGGGEHDGGKFFEPGLILVKSGSGRENGPEFRSPFVPLAGP